MKRIFTHLIILLCSIVILTHTGCAEETASPPPQPRDFIRQLVYAYADSGKREEQALASLYALDPSLGEKWERIMDLWEEPLVLHEELPDGLAGDDTLCLVVLGFRLNPDGTMRDELIGRLTVALAAALKYPKALIVCTGGPTASSEPAATEAGRMTEWLAAHGVDPARLIAEDRSLTTGQNARFTFDILTERFPKVRQVAVITSDYHIALGRLLLGAEAILRGSPVTVQGNAAWPAPSGTISVSSEACALLSLSADRD